MIRIAFLLASFVGFLASAQAQAPIYLDIPGIPGESRVAGYEDQIEVFGYSQSVANLDGAPVVLPLRFQHFVDKASPLLIEAVLLGSTLDTATLSVVTTGAAGTVAYIVIELMDPKVVAIESGDVINGRTRLWENFFFKVLLIELYRFR